MPRSTPQGWHSVTLTIHHWPDWQRGIQELRRVASERMVIVTWDPAHSGFWLTDYFLDVLQADRESFPTLLQIGRELGAMTVCNVPVPHDCSDGFLGAYWRRPEAYLSDGVRAAITCRSSILATGFSSASLQSGGQRLLDPVWQR
jgi:hypothetical protein